MGLQLQRAVRFFTGVSFTDWVFPVGQYLYWLAVFHGHMNAAAAVATGAAYGTDFGLFAQIKELVWLVFPTSRSLRRRRRQVPTTLVLACRPQRLEGYRW